MDTLRACRACPLEALLLGSAVTGGLCGEALRAKGRAEQGQEVGKPSARLTTNYFRQPLGLENSMAMGSSQKLC